MVAIDDVKKMMYAFYKANNIPYIESHANFVYYSMNTYKGDFAKELENKKILCGGINEEKGKWYRVTVGTENEIHESCIRNNKQIKSITI
jgi:histidinol-phosphate aminotransferase